MQLYSVSDEYINYQTYWESSWKEEDSSQLQAYLEGWKNYHGREIELLKEHQVKFVCDAACGFGAYTIAFAANGFKVSGFDISPASVEITRQGLIRCGFDYVHIKIASILDTGYEDAAFDAVNAHAVLDHLTVADAKRAIGELFRITRKGGLVMISFDGTEEEDFAEEHVEIEPGTMQYINGSRKGMLFHPYEWEEIDRLLETYEVVEKWSNRRWEKIVVLRK